MADPVRMWRSGRVLMCRSSSGFGHHQIVAMNDLIATTVPEDVGDFTTLVAGNATDIGARVGREPAARFGAASAAYDHRVAALEGAFNGDHTGRQEARAAPQGSGCPVIDNHRP